MIPGNTGAGTRSREVFLAGGRSSISRSSLASSKNASMQASSYSVRRATLFSGLESPGVGEWLGAGKGDERPPVLGGVV